MKVIPFVIVVMVFFQALAQQDPTQKSDDQSTPVATPIQDTGKATVVPVQEPVKQVQAPAPNPDASDRAWKFGLGLGFSLSSKLKFDNGQVSSGGATTSLTADLDYKNAAILDFEGRFMPINSWGVILGVQVDGEREFDSGTISGGGTTVKLTSSGGASKLQVTNYFGSATYRWEQFYIPLGFNLSVVKFTPAAGSTGTSDASGGLGAQIGVGFLPTEHFAFEVTSRAVAVKLKNTSSTSTVDYGTGYLSSLTIIGKYIF